MNNRRMQSWVSDTEERKQDKGRKESVCGGGGMGWGWSLLFYVGWLEKVENTSLLNGFVSRSKGGDGINHAETWGKSIL